MTRARTARRALTSVLSGVLVCLLGCRSPQAAAEAGADQVPRFSLTSLDGEVLGPQDFAGSVLLIEFWATWCLPCHVQADILHELYPRARQDGAQFLAVSLGEPEEVVREFASRRPFPYPVLLDPTDSVSAALGIYVLPTVMILDRSGRVSFLRQGLSTAETLAIALAEARAAKPAGGASVVLH